ncbi:uncharacterized protein YALI1_C18380g [Yarrowia lipolytica]|uniref:Uncharacterized protein n=1 Tax=Yarrowia lipolytica TaxID=4952 RepID=A0A1D8NAX9_YARLL|nr:hypothetical protein YALI1_C18380g [Yarrowia lipolytica]
MYCTVPSVVHGFGLCDTDTDTSNGFDVCHRCRRRVGSLACLNGPATCAQRPTEWPTIVGEWPTIVGEKLKIVGGLRLPKGARRLGGWLS